ncbi:hypothetical protein D3C73_498000 [compost metagenome]
MLPGSAADQRIGDRAHSAADRADQGAGRRFTGAARLTADHGASRQILAVLGQVEGFFVDRYVSVADCFQTAVTHIDGDGGGAFVTVGIAHGVGEHIHRTGTAHCVRVAVIDRVAVGIEGQVAVGAVDLAVQAADRRGRSVAAGTHADHRATRRWAIRASDVVVQHVAADSAALRHRGRIRFGGRHVIDDVDVQFAMGGGVVVIDHDHGKRLGNAVGAVASRVTFVIGQGVAVAHHTGHGIKPGDGQRAAQRSDDRLREACDHATADDGDTANGQGLHTVQRGDGEGAALGQRRRVGASAVAEVFFVDGQFAAFNVQAVNSHRVVVVMDVQHQVGGTGIAVGIGQGVGEGFSAVATAMQGFEVGVAGVQGVGVSAVGIQHQSAVSADESAGGNRPGIFTHRHTVRALHIVGQYVAVEGQLGFRRHAVTVVDGFWHVVGDVDIQRSVRRVAIAVAGHHGEVFTEGGAVAARMGFVAVEGVAVTHNASGRVVTGDGQGAAQRGRDRLREAHRDTAADHVDPADAQVAQPVEGCDGERAVLGQCSGIAGRAVGEIGFVDGEFTALHRQALEGDGIVRHRWNDWRNDWRNNRLDRRRWRAGVRVGIAIVALFGKLGNAVKTGSGKADVRIDAPTDFFKHDETVPAPRRAARCTGRRPGCRGFRGLRRVVTSGNGFLQLFDIAQLRLARGHRFGCVDVGGVISQQLWRHLQAAAPTKGQFLAILQMHRYRALGPGRQLITSE